MKSNLAERVRELEAELAAERARVVELRHVLAAMGASAIEVATLVPKLIVQITKREAEVLEQAIADASYKPEPNAVVEGADAPEDAAS